MYSVLNTLSGYTYFIYQKTFLHTLFCLFLKLLKACSVSLSQFNFRNSFAQILDILSCSKQNLMHLFCIASSLLIFVSLKDLETKLWLSRHNQKEVDISALHKSLREGVVKKRFCLCRNLRCEIILSITFKAIDLPERLSSKIRSRCFTFKIIPVKRPFWNLVVILSLRCPRQVFVD